jgi:serine/threonine-protein kinase RsbW
MSSLRIVAELKNLKEIRRFVREAAMALGVDAAAVSDVVRAVDEAASNIILHGYKLEPGIIEIDVLRERDALMVRLRDEAPTFDFTQVPVPDVTLPLEERPAGGMGVYFMRKLMDEVRHRSRPGGGNELILIRKCDWEEPSIADGTRSKGQGSWT